MIDFQPFSYRFLSVIVALDKGFSSNIVLVIDARWIEYHVVNPTRSGMNSPPRQPPYDLLVGHFNFNDKIDGHTGSFHSVRLGNGPRRSEERRVGKECRSRW